MAAKFIELTFTEDVQQAQARTYGRAHRPEAELAPDALTPSEAAFIRARDSFYLASVGSEGWPYLQHRGGPAGFLKVLGPHTLAFADFGGNRQLLSTGNLAGNDRVCLFLMDYVNRARLKILGHARVVPAAEEPGWIDQLVPPDQARLVERIFFIDVVAFDWNCPKFITPRYTAAQVEAAMAPLKSRIAQLESQLHDLTS